jgi:hypothetical protein
MHLSPPGRNKVTDDHIAVMNVDPLTDISLHASVRQFREKRVEIQQLEKPRPERAMNFHRQTDHLFSERVILIQIQSNKSC